VHSAPCSNLYTALLWLTFWTAECGAYLPQSILLVTRWLVETYMYMSAFVLRWRLSSLLQLLKFSCALLSMMLVTVCIVHCALIPSLIEQLIRSPRTTRVPSGYTHVSACVSVKQRTWCSTIMFFCVRKESSWRPAQRDAVGFIYTDRQLRCSVDRRTGRGMNEPTQTWNSKTAYGHAVFTLQSVDIVGLSLTYAVSVTVC